MVLVYPNQGHTDLINNMLVIKSYHLPKLIFGDQLLLIIVNETVRLLSVYKCCMY